MTAWLKQSTSVSVVIGPIWATADGSLKADLAYNASGMNCDVYKNGTKADVTLANSAGDGYFRAASGEALYLLTLSTGHTDTLGTFTISLSATGYYMKPQHYMVVPANVWDSMFGADTLKCEVVEISGDTAAADNLESYCDGTTPIPANAIQISGDATAADNCELMFDGTGYAGGTTKLAVEVNTKTGFSLANGSIAAATFAAGALDAAALAADAGTEIGAAVKTAIEAAGSHLTLIKAKTDNLPANTSTVLGTPAGASLAADVAAVKSDSAAILVDTGTTLDGNITAIKAKTDLGLLNTTWTDAKAAYLDEAISAAKTLTSAYDAAKTAATQTSVNTIGDFIDTEVAAILAAVDTEVAAIVAAVITNAAGADVAADIIAVKAAVDAILADTGTDGVVVAAGSKTGYALANDAVSAAALAANALAEIADAVWDEILSGHAGAGSAGAALSSASSAGDPWSTAIPGAYEAGTAGYVLGTQGATGSGLSAVPWNASWDAEVQSECTDALNAYDPPTKDELDAADDAILAVLGTPAGADMAADIAALPTATENADALLNRDMSAVSDTTARSPLNALRQLRNRVAIADGTMTVYEEDDTTEAWTGAVTTSASVEPITEIDPA